LNKIIHSKIENERISWQKFLSRIIQIRPEKALILDLDKGIINEGNQKIIIDESIVDKFKLIKEGEFNEKIGAPTLKLVGSISNSSVEIGKVIEKPILTPYAITTDRIFEAFFNQSCSQPFEFLSRLCYESSHYFPIWFFVSKSKKSVNEVEDVWSSFQDVMKDIRENLIDRLSSDHESSYEIAKILPLEDDFSLLDVGHFEEYALDIKNKLRLPERSIHKIKRSIVYNAIMSGHTDIVTNIIENDPRPVFEALSHIPSNNISKNKDWVLKSLKDVHSLDQNTFSKTDFRKAVCSVDIKLYHP
jgi:hypothetical protein